MITVMIQGGLGNQLFQYAYARALLEMGKEVQFDISFFDTNTKYTKREYLLDKFCIDPRFTLTKVPAKQKLITKLVNKLDIDRQVRYVKVNNSSDNFFADGYYASEKYFAHMREIILKDLTLKHKSDLYKEWEAKILSAKKPLMVHARRTDHILNKTFTRIEEDYYARALPLFEEDCDIFGFSDNAEWLQNAIKRPVTMVSGLGFTDYEELMLMSLGQNFIIANSTYSWWGAWLSKRNDKKIVALQKWFRSLRWWRANNDIEFAGWTRI